MDIVLQLKSERTGEVRKVVVERKGVGPMTHITDPACCEFTFNFARKSGKAKRE